MPIPKPKTGESQGKFISRCMGDKIMVKEYPENAQRAAVCYSSWRKKMSYGFDWSEFNKLLEIEFQKITVEEGGKYWRVRVKSPSSYDPKSFRTIDITKSGTIRAVVGCPKGNYRAGKCQVGVEAQAYLFDMDAFTKKQAKKWVIDHRR